jgi:ATP/maltotriose-dependent transcriptional regulator MalT
MYRPEMANELPVAVNTVNSHVHNIYAKFRSQDRRPARTRRGCFRWLDRVDR